MPNLGGVAPLRKGDICAQLDEMDFEGKIIAHVACSMTRWKSPKTDLMWLSNFEGDGFHLDLLKNPQMYESSSFVIHIPYYKRASNFLKFMAWPK